MVGTGRGLLAGLARRLRRPLGLAAAVLFTSLGFSPALSQPLQPQFQGSTTPSVKIPTPPVISPSAADTFYNNHAKSATWHASGRPNEIVELARALKNDPDKIYQYVRNNIEISWSYGLQKGPLGAVIDRSGTSFDQAMLMVELLRQAGYPSATYLAGTITLNGSQFQAWSGITSAMAACQLLSSGGFGAEVNTATSDCSSYGAESVTSVRLEHIWVSVNIGGTAYLFDPAYKPHDFRTGINLQTAMGLTPGDPLSAATSSVASGMTQSGVPYVKNFSTDTLTTGLNAKLTTYSSALLQYLYSNNLSAAEMEDIVGGQFITRYEGALRQTSLPYTTSLEHTWSGAIPDVYRTTLTVQISKNSSASPLAPVALFATPPTLFVDEIYGRKLIFDTNFDINHSSTAYLNFVGDLRLLDEAGAGPTIIEYAAAPDPTLYRSGLITLTADHPYAASTTGGAADGSYMDASTLKAVNMTAPFIIVHGWGDTGRGLVDKWGQRSDKAAPTVTVGQCDTCVSSFSSSVGDGRREQLAASWLAQATRAAGLHAQIANSVFTLHHSLGIVAADVAISTIYPVPANHNVQYDQITDSFDRVDVDSAFSLTSKIADVPSRRAAVHAIAATWEALEGGVSAQISDLPDTTSTATRFEWANRPPVAEDPDDDGIKSANGRPAPGSIRTFYQFTPATAGVLVAGPLIKVENVLATSPLWTTAANNDGDWFTKAQPPPPPGPTVPEMSQSQAQSWKTRLAAAIGAFGTANFDTIVTSEEAFLGPGQEAGRITGNNPDYVNLPSKQRGGAIVATRYASGEPVEIAHAAIGYDMTFKGGGGGAQPVHQASYDPSKAADVLKARFVDKSKALGVDLQTGGLTYTSPASLRVGNGGFPYELSAQLIWRAGSPTNTEFGPTSHTQPEAPWTTNWNNTLTISGSGLEAMGDSDPRAAAGTIAAFVAAQDVYKASQSPQRDITGVLVNAWWAHQLSGNVVTANIGADTRQFVHLPAALPDGRTWIATGPGPYATLLQSGQRAPGIETCASRVPYQLTRGWVIPAGSYFEVTNANGDRQHFDYWTATYQETDGNFCRKMHGFRLSNWIFPQGVTITLNYTNDSPPQLLSVSNNLGRTIQLVSEGMGGFNNGLSGSDLRTVTVTANGDGTVSHTDPNNASTKFSYTIAGWNTDGWYLLDKVYSPIPPNAAILDYDYDTLRRVMQVKDGDAIQLGTRNPYQFYIANGVRGERVDPTPASYAVEYDTKLRPIEYIDELGRMTRVGVYNGSGVLTRPAYDGRKRIGGYTYPEGDREAYAYDDRNNTLSLTRTAKPGSAEEPTPIIYSATWDPTWNKPKSITDPSGNVTDLAYFGPCSVPPTSCPVGASMLTSLTRPDPDGGGPLARPVYSFTYSSIGKVLTSTDPTPVVTSNAYLANGDLSSTRLDPNGVNATTAYTYTANGDVVSVDGPLTGTTDTSYSTWDKDRRKLMDIGPDPDGAGSLLRPMTRTTYDNEGHPTRIERGRGVATDGSDFYSAISPLAATALLYDPVGNKTQQTVFIDGVSTTPLTITQYGYDNDNRLACTAVRMNIVPSVYTNLPPACFLTVAGSNGYDRIVNNVYDAAGELTTIYKGWGTLAPTRYASYTYTLNGQRQTALDGRSNVSTYGYDGFDRLKTLTFPSAGAPPSPSNPADYEQYTYDINGNQTLIRKRDGTTIGFYYDALNRLTIKGGGTISDRNYTYDAAGRMQTTHYYYNSAGVDYGYDTAGRLTAETSFGKQMAYQYDAAGNRIQITWPDGFAASYAYDQMNRMTAVCETITPTACQTATTLGQGLLVSYAYDDLGRRTSIGRTNGTTTTYSQYDAADRLGSLKHDLAGGTADDLTLSFAFNPAGQIVSRGEDNSAYTWGAPTTHTVNGYSSNGLNQDATIAVVGAQPCGLYSGYDCRGNLVNDGHNLFYYDGENHLYIDSGLAVGQVVINSDPLGRLWYQTIGVGSPTNTNTGFLYSGQDLVAEYASDANGLFGALQHRYVPGAGQDEPAMWYSVTDPSPRRWLYADNQGSIIAWADSNGLASGSGGAKYTYGPYGEPNTWGGARYRYTGQIMLPELQLYHYKARAYDPVRGWFLQTDPVGDKSDLDLYAYVAEDPIDKSDPTGLQEFAFPPGPGMTPAETQQYNEGYAKGSAAGLGIVATVASNFVPVLGEAADTVEIGALGSEGYTVYRGTTLARNMDAAGNGVVRGAEHAHHIVGQGAEAAKPAQDVLRRVGIGIHSAENGAAMKSSAHAVTHTTDYYSRVNDALITAEKGGIDAVKAVLKDFQSMLQGK